jgi:hypothetical protein
MWIDTRETGMHVVAATKLELPSIFCEAIIALLVILLLLAAFSETTFGRVVALGGQGFGLALLVALVFIFDEPFKGQTSISPDPIGDDAFLLTTNPLNLCNRRIISPAESGFN